MLYVGGVSYKADLL